MNLKLLIKNLKTNKKFLILLLLIFILHLLTYPSIHNIIDEFWYLDASKKICRGDLSYFLERDELPPVHGPLYHTILCLTSPVHGFDIEKAQVIAFLFLIFLVIGWYFSVPIISETTKKRMTVLIFANSLLWIYSFRVLIDVPFAFFFSLGLLNSYLFFEFNKRKNYYLSILFLSFALLTKEGAMIFPLILLTYLFLKKDKNIKKWSLLLIPFVPYIIYLILTSFLDVQLYKLFFKITNPKEYSWIPYANFPTIFFILGIFGPGIISCILMWKNLYKMKKLKNFLVFALILYLWWEVMYDFILKANLPKYHTTLIPFLTLIISEASTKSRNLKYIYYLTFVFTLSTGFFIAYYFHISEVPIWKYYNLGTILNLVSIQK